jgi:hypothetical protein
MNDLNSGEGMRPFGLPNRPSTPIDGVVHCKVLNTAEHKKKEHETAVLHHRDLTLNMNRTLKRPRDTKTSLLVHGVGQVKAMKAAAKLRPQSAVVHKPRSFKKGFAEVYDRTRTDKFRSSTQMKKIQAPWIKPFVVEKE